MYVRSVSVCVCFGLCEKSTFGDKVKNSQINVERKDNVQLWEAKYVDSENKKNELYTRIWWSTGSWSLQLSPYNICLFECKLFKWGQISTITFTFCVTLLLTCIGNQEGPEEMWQKSLTWACRGPRCSPEENQEYCNYYWLVITNIVILTCHEWPVVGVLLLVTGQFIKQCLLKKHNSISNFLWLKLICNFQIRLLLIRPPS